MTQRKISAHYAFGSDGLMIKYPVISFSSGKITSISSSSSLHEVAGLEFYSGVLFPLFIDIVGCKDIKDQITHTSFNTPIVSKVILQEGAVDSKTDLSQLLISKLTQVPLLNTPFNGDYDSLPLIERISLLVQKGYFKNYLEAFYYYTSFNNIKSEIAVGAKAEFVLCRDLSFINGGQISSSMFGVLR